MQARDRLPVFLGSVAYVCAFIAIMLLCSSLPSPSRLVVALSAGVVPSLFFALAGYAGSWFALRKKPFEHQAWAKLTLIYYVSAVIVLAVVTWGDAFILVAIIVGFPIFSYGIPSMAAMLLSDEYSFMYHMLLFSSVVIYFAWSYTEFIDNRRRAHVYLRRSAIALLFTILLLGLVGCASELPRMSFH